MKFRREAKSNQKDKVLYGYFKHCFTDRCPKEIGKKVLSSEQRWFLGAMNNPGLIKMLTQKTLYLIERNIIFVSAVIQICVYGIRNDH